MNKIIASFFIVALLACNHISNDLPKTNVVSQAEILKQIQQPHIADTTINILNFGAKGDSITNNAPIFKKAIDSLYTQGGGKIIIPAGEYFMDGPIHFKSGIELHLEEGARIFFCDTPESFLPVVKTSWEGTLLSNYSPFIYAYQCKNIAITGKGIIDGNASGLWMDWKKIQTKDQLLSREMNHNNIPVNERIFGEGHYLRPQLIQFFNCENILVEDVKIEDSPFWCIHLLKCNSATIRGVRYNAFNKNNDGIDPEYSKNILIENVHFNNGDDNVAIKAGRDHEGRNMNRPSENIIIRNCFFNGLHAIVIGSEMSSGVQNVYVNNCTFSGEVKRGIYLKSNPDRGGYIRNIFIDSIQFGTVEDLIYITSFYHNEGVGYATEFSNICFNNITCEEATQTGIVLQGFPEKKLKGVKLSNINIKKAANAVSMLNTDEISFKEIVIGELATTPSYVK